MPQGRVGRIRSALFLLGLTSGLALTAPALAHDQLVESFPPAGAQLEGSPAEITLAFGGELQAESSQVLESATRVIVTDADGEIVLDDPGRIAGPVLVVPVEPPLGPGTYLVTWTVIDYDGHIVADFFDFTVLDDGPPVSPDSPTFTDPADETDPGDATGVPGVGDTGPGEEPAEPAGDATAEGDPASDGAPSADPDAAGPALVPWILGGAAVLGAAAWWVARRRR